MLQRTGKRSATGTTVMQKLPPTGNKTLSYKFKSRGIQLWGGGGKLAQWLLWAGSPAARVKTKVSLSLRLTAKIIV